MPKKKTYQQLVPIQFLVTPDDKQQYEQLCTEEGSTMTEDLRRYLKRRISRKKSKKIKVVEN